MEKDMMYRYIVNSCNKCKPEDMKILFHKITSNYLLCDYKNRNIYIIYDFGTKAMKHTMIYRSDLYTNRLYSKVFGENFKL